MKIELDQAEVEYLLNVDTRAGVAFMSFLSQYAVLMGRDVAKKYPAENGGLILHYHMIK